MVAEQDVLRWYTPALRIPKFLGKLPSGERLPGGPYTQAQGATFAAAVVVAGVTRQWWSALLPEGPGWGLVSYLFVLGLGVAAGLAAKFTPRTSMNPLTIAGGAVGQIFRSTRAPAGGHRRGVVRGVVTITSHGRPLTREAMREVGAPRPAFGGQTWSVRAGKAGWNSTRPTSSGPLAPAPAQPEGGIAAKLAELVAAAPRNGSDARLRDAAGRS